MGLADVNPRKRPMSDLRYCTGCCQRKRHTRLWFGTYCTRCRLRTFPHRWRFQILARFYDWQMHR